MKNPALELNKVFFIRNDQVILSDVTWLVEEGTHWILLGPNGSGKTTLLKLLAGYLWPTRGTITVMGNRFGQVDVRSIRSKLGWVGSFLQEYIAFEQTPRDIIMSGKYGSLWLYEPSPPEVNGEVERTAQLVGCDGILQKPYGLLSQGEKQRVLLARALINTPPLLLLDEPCIGLDVLAREHFLHTLEQLPAKTSSPLTVIMVTHHLEEISPMFSKAVLLKEGRIMASGNLDQVLTSENLANLFDKPVRLLNLNGRYWAHFTFDRETSNNGIGRTQS